MLRDWLFIILSCALLLLAMHDYAKCEETANKEADGPVIWCGNFLFKLPDGSHELRQICLEDDVVVFVGHPDDEPFIEVDEEENK